MVPSKRRAYAAAFASLVFAIGYRTLVVSFFSTATSDAAILATTGCPCRSGVDNFCLYGRTSECDMTLPGGYCDPNGNGNFDDADWVRGWEEYHASCVAPPPSGECSCRADVDNFCSYGADAAGCAMTAPGGYCDPNGDGSFNDADWVRGWEEYRAACVSPPADECPCREDVDNFCSYGADATGCVMTAPGGYCDPNGDGSFNDADWVRGWLDYRTQCVTTSGPTPTPVPTATPLPAVRPRQIGIEGPVCLYYDQRSTAWGVRPGARIINNGTTTEQIVMQVQSVAQVPEFGQPLDGTLIATGFFGFALPPHFAFSGQFSFHHDVPQPPPPTDEFLVISVVAVDAVGGPGYTDFISFGRISENFPSPKFTTCVTASPTTAPR